MDADSRIDAGAAASPARSLAPAAAHLLRNGLLAAVLALYWAFVIGQPSLDIAMFPRFFSRVIAHALLGLFCLGWWLSNRQFSGWDRLRVVGLLIICLPIAVFLADRSMNVISMLMMGVPTVLTAWGIWAVVSNKLSLGIQRSGFVVLAILALGYFTLLRVEGLDGLQRTKMSWRWSPSAEDLFLASKQREPVVPAAEALREWALQAGDWPEFRGADRNGVVRDVKFATDWTKDPPQLVWRQRVGPAWSSMIVVDGFLVTQEQRGDKEAVVCYEAATGKEAWAHSCEERFSEVVSGAGPRGTPTFHSGRIYALGAKGQLTCLAAETGKPLWSRDVLADASAEVLQWGCAASPLVIDNLVIVFAGGEQGRSWLACHADTGEIAWSRAGGKSGYTSPQLVSIEGERQVLLSDNHSLMSVHAQDGKVLWERATGDERAAPMLQPLALSGGDCLLQSEPGIVLVNVQNADERWTTSDRWTTNAIKPSFNDFIVHDGHIYGLDDGILCCVDVQSGKRLWKKGRYGHGQLLLVSDSAALVVLCENGEVALVAARPDRHEELGRFQAIDGKTWNHPVIAQDRLFVRNGEEMACYRLQLTMP